MKKWLFLSCEPQTAKIPNYQRGLGDRVCEDGERRQGGGDEAICPSRKRLAPKKKGRRGPTITYQAIPAGWRAAGGSRPFLVAHSPAALGRHLPNGCRGRDVGPRPPGPWARPPPATAGQK